MWVLSLHQLKKHSFSSYHISHHKALFLSNMLGLLLFYLVGEGGGEPKSEVSCNRPDKNNHMRNPLQISCCKLRMISCLYLLH